MPDFYRVLARLPVEFKGLTIEGQKRLTRQVIRDIRLNIISKHVFLLYITWEVGIAACTDVALVWRGMTPNTSDDWTPEEDAILRRLYPQGGQAEVMAALPTRAWGTILNRAHSMELRRLLHGPLSASVYPRTLCYDDLLAVRELSADPQRQQQLCDAICTLARRTVRGGLSAHWWIPFEIVCYVEGSAIAQFEALVETPAPLSNESTGETWTRPIRWIRRTRPIPARKTP